MEINAKTNDLVVSVAKKIGIVVGPAVVDKKKKVAVSKLSFEGRPVGSIIYSKDGGANIRGLDRLRSVVEEYLTKNGLAYDISVNPNHAIVFISEYEEGGRIVSRKGAPSSVALLLLEALNDYLGG